MHFPGNHSAGTPVPPGGPCPNRTFRVPLVMLILVWLPPALPTPLIPGRHNSTAITSCTGYNPSPLSFTTLPSGGYPPYSYQWQLNDTPIPGEISTTYDPPQLAAAGIFSINCAITDSLGDMVFTEPKVITIVPDPQVTADGGGIFCKGTVVTLTSLMTEGTGPVTYQWSSSDDNATFDIIPGATASTYSPESDNPGTRYFRVVVLPAVGACNNATSPGVQVTILELPSTSMIFHL